MDPAQAIEVAALSKQRAMNEAMARGDSDIQRFYNNSVVFLTGGSGFLGKQLIEKLLRSCQITKVFFLLRSKKGKHVNERLDEILKDQIFDSARQQNPNLNDKIVAIEGDVAEIRLGIKDEDWKTLTEEVNVIFHVAATTKFDETLRLATFINIRGTREALLLGRACKNLRAYVHVSTAYTHATTSFVGEEVKEEFYKIPIPPEAMISMAENMDPARLENIMTNLINNWPNTYTFTKALAEELVRTMSTGLPICIVRPGIVLCTYREPLPGWLDTSCVYGASGIIFGAALGILHALYANSNNNLGIVPCDYVNNAIIVAGRETATNQAKGGNDTRIYTVSTTHRNPNTWGTLHSTIKREGSKIASPKAFYYCYAINTSSKLLFMILSLFLHFVPACIADFACLLMGKQRRFVKTTKKVYRMTITLSYFLLNEWHFTDNNLARLYSSLSKRDKTIFFFDITDLNWTEFVQLWCVGVRKYLLKDGLKDTEYALKKQRYLKIANYFIMTLYIYSIWKLTLCVFCVGTCLFSALIKLNEGL